MIRRKQGHDQLDRLLARVRAVRTTEDRYTLLGDVIDLHHRLLVDEPETAHRARQLFLLVLADSVELAARRQIHHFLVEYVTPADFHTIPWERPEQVIKIAQILCPLSSSDETAPDRLCREARELIVQAALAFEHRGDDRAVRYLLQHAPPRAVADPLADAPLVEEPRVAWWGRRRLFGVLITQIVLLVFIFPFLMIHIENGRLAREGAASAPVERLEEDWSYQPYSYLDGLAWSVFTASASGRSEDTPQTPAGKTIALMATGTKVLTVGVLAKLIHESAVLERYAENLRTRPPRHKRTDGEETGHAVEREEIFLVNGRRVALRGRSDREIAVSLVTLLLEKAEGQFGSPMTVTRDEPGNILTRIGAPARKQLESHWRSLGLLLLLGVALFAGPSIGWRIQTFAPLLCLPLAAISFLVLRKYLRNST